VPAAQDPHSQGEERKKEWSSLSRPTGAERIVAHDDIDGVDERRMGEVMDMKSFRPWAWPHWSFLS
jgi:hypothetical protein